MSYLPQDPASERIDIRDLPPLPPDVVPRLAEGGPVLPPRSVLFIPPELAGTRALREIRAMAEAAAVLERLDDDARVLVATWLFNRYAAARLESRDGQG